MTTWSWETPTVAGVCCWPLWIPLAVNVSVEAWSYEFWISVSSLEICKFSIWGTRVEVFICSSKSPTHTNTQKNCINLSHNINFFPQRTEFSWVHILHSCLTINLLVSMIFYWVTNVLCMHLCLCDNSNRLSTFTAVINSVSPFIPDILFSIMVFINYTYEIIRWLIFSRSRQLWPCCVHCPLWVTL